MNWTQAIIVAVPVAAGFITWALNERSKRRSEEFVRRARLYEELSESLERMFSEGEPLDGPELSLRLNQLFAKLALYAPDNVYLAVKDSLVDQTAYGGDVKPVVYHELRKSLFGKHTSLSVEDMQVHLNVTPLAPRASVAKLTSASSRAPGDVE